MVDWSNYEKPNPVTERLQSQYLKERQKSVAQQDLIRQRDIDFQHSISNTNNQQSMKVTYFCCLCESKLAKTRGRKTELLNIERPRLKCPSCESIFEKNFSNNAYELTTGLGHAIKTVWNGDQ